MEKRKTSNQVANDRISKSDDQWRAELSEEEYRVMRMAGTEPPFSGEHNLNFKEGTYFCKGCGTALFNSESKFDGHCGWPSFDHEIEKGIVKEKLDKTHGVLRTEIVCSVCDSHLGHVLNDGTTGTGLRYCVNSVSIDFNEKK